jgi:hypothetical protein
MSLSPPISEKKMGISKNIWRQGKNNRHYLVLKQLRREYIVSMEGYYGAKNKTTMEISYSLRIVGSGGLLFSHRCHIVGEREGACS